MKAAVVTAPNTTPIYTDFQTPKPQDGEVLLTVKASALSHVAKGSAMGNHYSSAGAYPLIAGIEGIGLNEKSERVYFVKPTEPFGALAQQVIVNAKLTIPVPEHLDDVKAAALVNPAMSSLAALKVRAHFEAGQTVLINGATGMSGRLAVQIAKQLGAGKIIVTGRNAEKLAALQDLGADAYLAFGENFEHDLMNLLSDGVDVVLDYLWGESAEQILRAVAKATHGQKVRYVSIGSMSGGEINLPAAVLRASGIEILGSGLRSVSLPDMLQVIRDVFAMSTVVDFIVPTVNYPLADIATAWDQGTSPRVVITM